MESKMLDIAASKLHDFAKYNFKRVAGTRKAIVFAEEDGIHNRERHDGHLWRCWHRLVSWCQWRVPGFVHSDNPSSCSVFSSWIYLVHHIYTSIWISFSFISGVQFLFNSLVSVNLFIESQCGFWASSFPLPQSRFSGESRVSDSCRPHYSSFPLCSLSFPSVERDLWEVSRTFLGVIEVTLIFIIVLKHNLPFLLLFFQSVQ